MRLLIKIRSLIIIGTFCLSSCSHQAQLVPPTAAESPTHVEPPVSQTPEKAALENPTFAAALPKDLCENLQRIKIIPYEKEEPAGDAIYDGLIRSGAKAIPCLLTKIVDTTIIEDPRYGDPHIHGFTVGDAAVFILLDITHIHVKEMLPPDLVEKEWETEGIYTYFGYVEDPKNRLKVQTWWAKRLNDTTHSNK